MRWLANLKKHIGDNILDINAGLMDKKVDTLNCITLNYNQQKKSQLTDDIQSVTNCDLNRALELASTHCNLVSTWALLFTTEKTQMFYDEFFKYCLDNKYCKENGFISTDKVTLFRSLGFDFTPVYNRDYKSLDDLPEGFYQMSITGHFIACYKTDRLYISDTSSRGYGKHYSIIPQSRFRWLLKY